jgi:transcriptional regulator with XRE-family HTH domain
MAQDNFPMWMWDQLKARNMTPQDFADQLGLPHTIVSNWIEKGQMPQPAHMARTMQILKEMQANVTGELVLSDEETTIIRQYRNANKHYREIVRHVLYVSESANGNKD